MGTEFITVKDDYTAAEWPDSRHTIVTSVVGDLADRIRLASGAEGPVTITEYGVETGYSEYTVEWDWDFTVKVGQETVFSTTNWSQADYSRPNSESSFNGLASLMQWLDKAAVNGSR